jgi:3,4-dihydroxy 2-butanone 4-phosphate synthase / GTP cyclohydrolase II
VSKFLSSTTEILEEVANGRMVILVDDEDRENEGDLIVPAQMATPEAINFMARFGRGLICLCLTEERTKQLGLEPMSRNNGTRHGTAFTTSIEASEGVDTGISAADRARTIAVAIDAANGPDKIVTPGHVFPLIARNGGALVRAGHTEAAVDLARLAGLNPSAVICEVMNDDGSMARLDDLVAFAQHHNLKLGTIRDLIHFRHEHDRLIERVSETAFETSTTGEWKAIAYRNRVDQSELLALVKGRPNATSPTLVRMHVPDPLADMFHARGPREGLLDAAMHAISAAGEGVIVVVSPNPRTVLTSSIRQSVDPAPDSANVLREYGIGAQVLADLGVKQLILLTNSHLEPIGLGGYGLQLVEERPLLGNRMLAGDSPC